MKKLLLVVMNFVTAFALGQAQKQDELVNAQIDNQKAQAEYYRVQTRTIGSKQSISSSLSGAIGTIIGAAVALTGVLLTTIRQSRIEDKKWKRAKRDEIERDTRLAVAELTKKLSVAIQGMQWATRYS